MRVLLCDERAFREALATLLAQRGHRVVGSVGSSAEAASVSARTSPDVILLGSGRVGDALGDLAELRRALPGAPLVLLAGEVARGDVSRATSAGARGIVLSSEGVDELDAVLVTAVDTTATGAVLSPQVRSLMRGFQRRRMYGKLTARSRAVLELLANGNGTKTIAASLGIAPSTVRSHIQTLLSEFGVHSRVELISLAVREGLVEPTLLSRPAGRSAMDLTVSTRARSQPHAS